MRPLGVVLREKVIEVCLQRLPAGVEPLAKRDQIALVEQGLVKAFTKPLVWGLFVVVGLCSMSSIPR